MMIVLMYLLKKLKMNSYRIPIAIAYCHPAQSHQHELADGFLILTHSSTIKKKQQLEEISTKLGLGLIVEVV